MITSARREALLVLGMWIAAFAWTVGYSAAFGYTVKQDPPLVFGIPAWVLWGVFLPWTACTLASAVLSWKFIADADLGEDPVEIRSEHEAAREIGDG
jgi:hypothetical protein